MVFEGDAKYIVISDDSTQPGWESADQHYVVAQADARNYRSLLALSIRSDIQDYEYISERDIREAGRRAAIIEDYPDDKYAPSCLLLGFTDAGRPLHIQVSYIESAMLKIITIYQPDAEEWYGYSRRR
jgi:hypothetical protein